MNTGASSMTSPSGNSHSALGKSLYPLKSPQYFSAISIEPVKRKISELATQISSDTDSGKQLVELCDRLGSPGSNTLLSETDVAYLMRTANDWPANKRFPGGFPSLYDDPLFAALNPPFRNSSRPHSIFVLVKPYHR